MTSATSSSGPRSTSIPTDAQITAVSDPLPQILEGIPLRLRSIRVNLDRPDFALNPTNCDPFSVERAGLRRPGRARPTSARHFQVANCADLRFGPKLALQLTGGTKRTGHPALHAVLTADAGRSQHRPRRRSPCRRSELLDNAHISSALHAGSVRRQRSCPPGSVIGTAKADHPAARQAARRPGLPGHAPATSCPTSSPTSRARSTSTSTAASTPSTGGLRTTFETVPDAPVTSFTLNLAGRHEGPARQQHRHLCAQPQMRAPCSSTARTARAPTRTSDAADRPAAKRGTSAIGAT